MLRQIVFGDVNEIAGEVILKDSQRHSICVSHTFDVKNGGIGGHTETFGHPSVSLDHLVSEQLCGWCPILARKIFIEACEFDFACDLTVHDLGTNPAATDEKPLVYEILDGSSHGRPRQAESLS